VKHEISNYFYFFSGEIKGDFVRVREKEKKEENFSGAPKAKNFIDIF
jgi:hypothetical protein